MKHTEKIASAGAALSALATLACCLPIGIAAGTATASLAAVAGSYRWWFLGASAVLLAMGAVELARVRRSCQTRGSASTVMLAVSATIVLLVVLFPQVLAGLIADWLP
jgi:cytochrome bd-type quinol oxidase subunit 2